MGKWFALVNTHIHNMFLSCLVCKIIKIHVCVCKSVFGYLQSYLEPVYFYIYTVFALQAVYVLALFLISWMLSDSWLAGTLAGVWYILNRYGAYTHGHN